MRFHQRGVWGCLPLVLFPFQFPGNPQIPSSFRVAPEKLLTFPLPSSFPQTIPQAAYRNIQVSLPSCPHSPSPCLLSLRPSLSIIFPGPFWEFYCRQKKGKVMKAHHNFFIWAPFLFIEPYAVWQSGCAWYSSSSNKRSVLTNPFLTSNLLICLRLVTQPQIYNE